MDFEKAMTFRAFADKAKRRIEAKKKHNKKVLHIGNLDEDIEIRGLSEQEFIECSEYSEDSILVDKYTIYYASKTLQDLAAYMVEEGEIKSHIEVCDMFSIPDRRAIAEEIMKISGVYDKSSVKELDEVKN